jgi:hypothetical protein
MRSSLLISRTNQKATRLEIRLPADYPCGKWVSRSSRGCLCFPPLPRPTKLLGSFKMPSLLPRGQRWIPIEDPESRCIQSQSWPPPPPRRRRKTMGTRRSRDRSRKKTRRRGRLRIPDSRYKVKKEDGHCSSLTSFFSLFLQF